MDRCHSAPRTQTLPGGSANQVGSIRYFDRNTHWSKYVTNSDTYCSASHWRRFFVLVRPSGALGSGGFEPAASACRPGTGGSVAQPSTPSTGALAGGTPRCNSASAAVGAGRPARSPSANKPDSGDHEPAAGIPVVGEFFCPLDFREGLKDLRKGPWEMLFPEAQASKGTSAPLRGALEARPELKPRYLTSKLRPGLKERTTARTERPHSSDERLRFGVGQIWRAKRVIFGERLSPGPWLYLPITAQKVSHWFDQCDLKRFDR